MAVSTLLSYWRCADWEHTSLVVLSHSFLFALHVLLSLISECRDRVHLEFPEPMRISILSLQMCVVNTVWMSSRSRSRSFWEGREIKNLESGPGHGILIWTSWWNPVAEGEWGRMFSSKFMHCMKKECSLERGREKKKKKYKLRGLLPEKAKISLR